MRPVSASLRISSGELSGISTLESGVESGTVILPTVVTSGAFLVKLRTSMMPRASDSKANIIAKNRLIWDFFFGTEGAGAC